MFCTVFRGHCCMLCAVFLGQCSMLCTVFLGHCCMLCAVFLGYCSMLCAVFLGEDHEDNEDYTADLQVDDQGELPRPEEERETLAAKNARLQKQLEVGLVNLLLNIQ